jgi:hypothetical protein
MNAIKKFEITVSKNQHEILEQPMLRGVLPISATLSVIDIEFIRLSQIAVKLFQKISRDFRFFATKQSKFVSHVTDDSSCARHPQREPLSRPSGSLLLQPGAFPSSRGIAGFKKFSSKSGDFCLLHRGKRNSSRSKGGSTFLNSG